MPQAGDQYSIFRKVQSVFKWSRTSCSGSNANSDHPPARSPILLLEDAEGCSARPRLADLIAARSVHAVARERSAAPTIGRPFARDSALAAWNRLQDQFDTSCIGLVAERGSGIANACLILKECLGDGTGPGAVALLGFSRDLVKTCASLIGRSDGPLNSGLSDAADGRGLASGHSIEWAPMVIFLPEDDSSIGECAGACRAMRSLGIPIRLEVMRSVRRTAAGRVTAVDELVGEIDRFFADYLTPYFPRLV